MTHARRRSLTIIAASIAIGLVSRKVPLGFVLWDKSLGDALYAVMIFGIVAFVRPNARSCVLGIVAFALCFAIELFQLTGIPKTLPRPLRMAIGDTFGWHDVACYAVAALAMTLIWRRWTGSR